MVYSTLFRSVCISKVELHRFWYQYYFHTERGRAGLTKDRRDICRLLWKLWSPEWRFDEATFEKSAVSFDNPDFVDVVIQSYRHRYGYAPGDPALAGTALEERYLALLRELKTVVSIPVTMKLSPFFSALPHFVAQVEAAGGRQGRQASVTVQPWAWLRRHHRHASSSSWLPRPAHPVSAATPPPLSATTSTRHR